MTLIQAWIDSVSLLKPKNAQLFFLVTIKSIIGAYKIVAHYWWWLIALIVGCYGVYICCADMPLALLGSYIVSMWLFQLLIFAVCLSTRPSLFEKNCFYFRSHMGYFMYTIPCLFFLADTFWPGVLSPVYFFYLFFFVDSERSLKTFFVSLFNALKMIVFNFPLLIAVGLLFYIPMYFVMSIAPVELMLQNVIGAFLLPITVCTYANIYIKKLHDQFDLYHKQPR